MNVLFVCLFVLSLEGDTRELNIVCLVVKRNWYCLIFHDFAAEKNEVEIKCKTLSLVLNQIAAEERNYAIYLLCSLTFLIVYYFSC